MLWIALLPLLARCAPEPPPEVSYLVADSTLPAYEHNLDHASFLLDWSEEFFWRGMITYRTNCFSCHGDPQQPGTIPNSRRFWSEPFKNGNDPLSLYWTLTRGHGFMPPQIHLTPQEKYDVILFLREAYLKDQNPNQYVRVTRTYIRSLPKGTDRGPKPKRYRPWADMDYGRFLMRTYDLANSTDEPKAISRGPAPLANEDFRHLNFAYKGIAVRLDPGRGGVAAGRAFVLFDHDLLRLAGFWTGEGFIDWEDILLDDQHNVFPRTVGTIQVENPVAPSWANPKTGSFDDPRFVAVDGRRFGPLPRAWAHYKGLYTHGKHVIFKYTVGDADVLEMYALESGHVMSRTLNVASSPVPLTLRIAPDSAAVAVRGGAHSIEDGFHVLTVPASTPVRAKIYMSAGAQDTLDALLANSRAPENLRHYTRGGPAQFTQVLEAPIIRGEDAAYAVDVLTRPMDNPWKSRLRLTGIDYLNGGEEAVVSTIDGEVWHLKGISQTEGTVSWRRIASGLFQPLGVKVHEGAIYVGCRDQIAVLRDFNGDGETDFYESFNSDHQVTEHFHEFAMGLQTDDEGNFYYAKSGRHARTALIPQHGTLIRVSADGSASEIIATGFRAANGVLVNKDGSYVVTDQEGFWNPMNRINWVEEGGFYGNMYGYGAPKDSSDEAMADPLVWIDSKYDRSPSELVWANSDRWGPLSGKLLNLSYGYGKMHLVMPQTFASVKQATMVELPLPQFATGLMRARMNPLDGQLYVLGMSAWATNQMLQVGGMYRVRYTGVPLHLPVEFKALTSGLKITFAEPLDKSSAENVSSWEVNTWQLKRTRRYGSKRYNEESLVIRSAELSADGRTVHLWIRDIAPTWIVEILYSLQSADLTVHSGALQGTIYGLEEN